MRIESETALERYDMQTHRRKNTNIATIRQAQARRLARLAALKSLTIIEHEALKKKAS